MSHEFEKYWIESIPALKEISDLGALEKALEEKFAQTEHVDNLNGEFWFRTAVSQLKPILTPENTNLILTVVIKYVLNWTFTDINIRLNPTVEIINFLLFFNDFKAKAVASELLNALSERFLKAAENNTPIDMNIFLALQAPAFSFSVGDHPDDEEVLDTWFFSLCNTCATNIFGSDKHLALSYFKLMNHAFFQNAVFPNSPSIYPGTPVPIIYKKIQENIRIAISKIATEIDEAEFQDS